MKDEKSSRLRYLIQDQIFVDRPLLYLKLNKSIHLSLGRDFDNYQFRRFSVDQNLVDNLIESRIKYLRNKYGYIRLWFGGGKDCTLVLNSFLKYKIKIDEIVVARRCCKNTLSLYSDFNPLTEIDKSAIDKLKSIQSEIPDTQISIIDFDDKEFEALFEESKWWLDTTEWFFSVAYLPKLFQKYVNPKLKLLTNHDNMCELVGSAIPAVYYNSEIKKWRFEFSAGSFNPIGPSFDPNIIFEDFLITDENPSILEAHVNSIVDSYEKENITPVYDKNIKEFERSVRDRSLFFKFDFDNFQLSKNDINFDFPSNDYFWKAGQSSRTFYELINRYYQKPMPRCLKLYIENTNWEVIKFYLEKRKSFFTKSWSLE
jgi:hypothetical protein